MTRAEKLKKKIKAKGHSYRTLESICGVRKGTISRYVNGDGTISRESWKRVHVGLLGVGIVVKSKRRAKTSAHVREVMSGYWGRSRPQVQGHSVGTFN